MTLVEFAEKTGPVPLTEWQKKFLVLYEQAKKEDEYLFMRMPRICGRQMLMQIIQEFEKEQTQ